MQRVDATSLSDELPRGREDGGAFGHATLGRALGGADVALAAEGRIDRDGLADEWRGSHALTLRVGLGALRVQAAHRSAFSPPSLGDQFFREGVAVRANPELQPERIPSEWELGASWAGALGGAETQVSASAFRSDVRGMIVWAPDFRSVWSPRNTDVKRTGAEAWGEVAFPAARLALSGQYTLARITYDRAGEDDDAVQVAYRPRHAAWLRAAWRPGAWTAGVAATYTGTRYPNPDRVNALPGFWSLGVDASREWRLGRAALVAAVSVDRLLDETDALIFGYPEPGRRVRIDLRLRRAGSN